MVLTFYHTIFIAPEQRNFLERAKNLNNGPPALMDASLHCLESHNVGMHQQSNFVYHSCDSLYWDESRSSPVFLRNKIWEILKTNANDTERGKRKSLPYYTMWGQTRVLLALTSQRLLDYTA